MSNGKQFSLESGDAVFIPNSDAHALLSDSKAARVNVMELDSKPVCGTVSCIKTQAALIPKECGYLQRLYGF